MPWTQRLPLIAILRGIRPDEVLAHAEVLVNAGFEAIEVPVNSPDWMRSVQLLAAAMGERVLIGAGTVLTPQMVDQLVLAQGRLVVTPNTSVDVIHAAKARDLVTCIGCMTVTEAFAAIHAGAQSIKIFPAANLGVTYIRALKAVLPNDMPVFAVGGITPDNLADYLLAGCVGAGLGGDLYKPGQAPQLTKERAQAFVRAYGNVINQQRTSL